MKADIMAAITRPGQDPSAAEDPLVTDPDARGGDQGQMERQRKAARGSRPR